MLRTIVGSLSYFGVLSLLFLIGLWGHLTHWSFGSVSHAGEHSEVTSAEHPVTGVEKSAEVHADELSGAIQFATKEDAAASDLEVAAVKVCPVDDHLTASAVVDYDECRLAHLAPRSSGHVYGVVKRLGQNVKRGEVILLVDSEEVGSAKAEFLQEAVMARFKQQLLDRILSIQGGAIPERTIRETQASLQEAQLRRFNSYQRLVNFGLAVDITGEKELSVEEMGRRIQFLGIPEEIVEQMTPRPSTANLIPMIAPFDGIVVQQQTVLGEMVRPEEPPVVVADVSRMWLRLSLRKEDARRVAVGQPVTFHGDGLTNVVEGKVTWISPEIDEKTRTVQARAEVINPPFLAEKGETLPGVSQSALAAVGDGPQESENDSVRHMLAVNQFGVAHVRVALYPEATLVPETALQQLVNGDSVVFVADKDGQTFHPRTVKVGVTVADDVQILEGVKPGESVVIKGAYILKSELLKSSMVAN